MCWVTKSQIKSCLTCSGADFCTLLGEMTQCIEPPAVKSWIFKFSGRELETGRQEKNPICRSNGTGDRSVSLFQFLKFRLIIPGQNYSLLRPYEMPCLSGRWQSSSQLNWHLEEQEIWRELQCLQFRRQFEQHIAEIGEHTVHWRIGNMNSHGNLGFNPLCSGKRNVSGQEEAGKDDCVCCNNILYQRHWNDAFLLNRNTRWQM